MILTLHNKQNSNRLVIDIRKKRNSARLWIALLVGVSVEVAPIYAQQPNKQIVDSLERNLTIDSVVVRASYNRDKIVPSQTLSGKALEGLNALSVGDAIRYFSGVQIKDYGGVGGLKTINVRGMGTQHVGVFYDGVQLGNAQNGQIDLGRFSLDNMSAISLYNGQKSSEVQSAKDYASASAVYLKSKTPIFKDGKPYNVKVKLAGGSFATINPSVLYDQKLGGNISNSFNAEYLYTSGEYKFSYTKADGYDTTAVRHNGDVRALRIEDGIFGRFDDGNWKVKLYYYDSERGYPGAFVREEPGKFKNEDRQWDTNFFTQGSFHYRANSWYRFSVNAKYAYDYLRYLSDPRLDVSTMYVDNTYRQQEGYASLANEFKIFSWWDVNLATDVQYNTLEANLTDFVYPSRLTALASLATSFDFGFLKLQGSVLETYVKDYVKGVGAAAEDKSILTPTVVANYTPFEDIDLSVRAFYKRIFRMPTLNDLYYTFIGNKYLNPEYTTQYNVGLSYETSFYNSVFKHIGATADVYYNEVKDKIIAMPTSNQFQWTMINLGYVEIRGVDLTANCAMQFGEVGVEMRATYTYQKAQDFTDPESTYYGGQIPYIPWNSTSAILGGQWKGWGLNYSFIYTGERYTSQANIPENYTLPWYTSDLAFSKNIEFKNATELKATLEVNNLFNQQYEVVLNYPMPGTNFKLILNYLF